MTMVTVVTVILAVSQTPSPSSRPSRKGVEQMKNVQISYDLLVDLVLYHLNGEDDFDGDIRRRLEQKLDAMLNRQLYSQYKTAPTEEQRERARQEYLDRRGVPESYRWTASPWKR